MGLTRIRAEQVSNSDFKQSCRVITTSNIANFSGGAPLSVDGVTLLNGDRVLVNGQSTGSENGLYKVNTAGIGSNGTWSRTSDANETGELLSGMQVMVTEGTTYGDSEWTLTTDGTITIGSTSILFEQLAKVDSTSGHVIQNAGSNLAARTNLNFDGTYLVATDDSGNDQTDVTVSTNLQGWSALTTSQFLRSDQADSSSGSITLTDSANLVFQDVNGTFPTSSGGFFWDLNNDEARIYAEQPASDQIDFYFKISDNVGSTDRFVYWVDDYRGSTYDKYPAQFDGSAQYLSIPVDGSGNKDLANARFKVPYSGNVEIDGNAVWNAGNDGAGSGLDADLLDGIDSSQFVRSDQNDTVSGPFSLTYSPSTTTALEPGSYGLSTAPFGAMMWHDLFAFDRNYTTTYETYDGSTWSSATLNNNIFAQKENQIITLATGASPTKVRWNFTGTAWGQANFVVIGFTYVAGGANRTITVESSADNSSWTQRHQSSTDANAEIVYLPISAYNGDNYLRITIDRDDTQDLKISFVSLLTKRSGDQGKGKEQQLPFLWNGDKDITLEGTLNGGTPWTTANDGAGSGLDADTLDGVQGSGYAQLSGSPTFSGGALTVGNGSTGRVGIGNDAGGSLSLGLTDNTSSTPYIDFNTGSTTVDYDARIQGTGGNGTSGGGTIAFTAGKVVFNTNTVARSQLGIVSTPKTVSADVTLEDNTNSMVIDNLTIADGISVTIPDSSTLKVLTIS